MATRVAIHGFGRIGRQAFRAIWTHFRDRLEVAAIGVENVDDAPAAAHLLKYDSNYGRFGPDVAVEDGALHVGRSAIPIVAAESLALLPWSELGVDIVVEATGAYVENRLAAGHLEAGARKVIVTSPCAGADLSLVVGMNDDAYDPAVHHVISTSSDTTNALAPVVRVLRDAFDVRGALVTAVRAYTNAQNLLDGADDNLRRARAAPRSIVPTTTRASRAISTIFPDMAGRISGYAVRVPVPMVSILELTVHLGAPASVDEINDAFRRAAEGPLSTILAVSDEPLVSTDFRGRPHAATVDLPCTLTIGPLAKVSAWYDNEYGYAMRVAMAAAMLSERGMDRG